MSQNNSNNSASNQFGLLSSDHYILYRPDIDAVEGISKSLTNKLGISVEDIQRKMQSNSVLSMGKIIYSLF